jgi:hypothetical protein
MSLVARLGPYARTTQDADATWRLARRQFAGYLADACNLDMGDGFGFRMAGQSQLDTDSPEGGERFTFAVTLAGRIFEQAITVDINYMPGDHRPVEWIQLAVPPTAELGLGPVNLPAIPIAQQLAEKLHAYLRIHGDVPSSRSRDLVDVLRVALRLPIPDRQKLAISCMSTFAIRGTSWPQAIPPPPADWARPWTEFVREYDLEWPTLPVAHAAFSGFWLPVIEHPDQRGAWDARRWEWR